jgi:uncharacterized repeat protein (TIGR03837 family)
MSAPRSWDVFCRVVDNFGDAAVCWRLARALATLPGVQNRGLTRLWIDDLAVLQALQPAVAPGRERQSVDGVEVCHWVEGAAFGAPADVAVDAFGAGLPETYASAMAARHPSSLWIVLEYLSAEPWVDAHHGLPSPHPRLPLERYFFFPGFGPGTGGLLREPELSARREDFLRQPQRREALWRAAGFAPPEREATVVSLFGYENPAVAELLEAWASGAQPVVAAVSQSRLGDDVAACLTQGVGSEGPGGTAGASTAASRIGRTLHRGALEVRFLPFLAQDRYDELLWAADWNFVRGEDSFVRAQWAERPFVWQAYPQSEGAHRVKLEAFLAAYCKGLAPALAAPLSALWRGWNDSEAPAGTVARAWSALTRVSTAEGAALGRHARVWAAEAARAGDLTKNLVHFCAKRLE